MKASLFLFIMKRRIEDLKPNECIHIRTEKEAKKLFEVHKNEPIEPENILKGFESYGSYTKINFEDGRICYGTDLSMGYYEVVSIKDFLPKKKSKTAKRLDRIEKRLAALEPMRLNLPAIEQKSFVLPEKWCVKFDIETKSAIEIFLDKRLSYDKGYLSFETSYPKAWMVAKYPAENHTEITTEQFIEHVLKEEPKQKLEAGKWYKSEDNGNFLLIHINSISRSEIKGYGFYNTEFRDERCWYSPESNVKWCYVNYKPATTEEVSAALIAEAERRGLKEGVEFTFEGTKASLKIGKKGFGYDAFSNQLYCNETAQCIFENGIWGVLIEQPKEIDFSVAGQLVVVARGDVYISSGIENNNHVLVLPIENNKVLIKSDWIKKEWLKPYAGTITLSNNGK